VRRPSFKPSPERQQQAARSIEPNMAAIRQSGSRDRSGPTAQADILQNAVKQRGRRPQVGRKYRSPHGTSTSERARGRSQNGVTARFAQRSIFCRAKSRRKAAAIPIKAAHAPSAPADCNVRPLGSVQPRSGCGGNNQGDTMNGHRPSTARPDSRVDRSGPLRADGREIEGATSASAGRRGQMKPGQADL